MDITLSAGQPWEGLVLGRHILRSSVPTCALSACIPVRGSRQSIVRLSREGGWWQVWAGKVKFREGNGPVNGGMRMNTPLAGGVLEWPAQVLATEVSEDMTCLL